MFVVTSYNPPLLRSSTFPRVTLVFLQVSSRVVRGDGDTEDKSGNGLPQDLHFNNTLALILRLSLGAVEVKVYRSRGREGRV